MVLPWDPDDFLQQLQADLNCQPPRLPAAVLSRFPTTANLLQLYREFLRSANFHHWFGLHRAPIQHLVAKSAAEEQAGFVTALQHFDEVRDVEVFFNLEQQISALADGPGERGNGGHASPEVDKLQRRLAAIFLAMSNDLQLALLSSPPRQQLLDGLSCWSPDQKRQLQLLIAALR